MSIFKATNQWLRNRRIGDCGFDALALARLTDVPPEGFIPPTAGSHRYLKVLKDRAVRRFPSAELRARAKQLVERFAHLLARRPPAARRVTERHRTRGVATSMGRRINLSRCRLSRSGGGLSWKDPDPG